MREFLLKKEDKLLKSLDYNNLRISGKKQVNNEFIIVYKSNFRKNSRLGITVSKKVGYAVKRNQIKRIIREFFRKNRDLLKESMDMNIIAKKSASFKTNDELLNSLNKVVLKIDN